MSVVRMNDLDLAGKRVLIREDLNVPIDAGRITSETRILAALPTLQLALDKGAAVMVMSHLGRPKEGQWTAEDSLAPVAKRLGELLGRDVPLVRDWIDGVEVKPGQLVLLENCRMRRRRAYIASVTTNTSAGASSTIGVVRASDQVSASVMATSASGSTSASATSHRCGRSIDAESARFFTPVSVMCNACGHGACASLASLP